MAKIIVTAALTGGIHVPSMSPYLPITPQQLIDESERAYDAGAAVVHIHARDPETGQPSASTEIFREIATSIKSKCNVIQCFTTGGTPEMSVADRAKVVTALKPEMATYNAGSLNFGLFPFTDNIQEYKFPWEKRFLLASENGIFTNTFKTLKEYSQLFAETNTKPELEVYDAGMIANLAYFCNNGYLSKPLHIQFVLGIMGGLMPDTDNLLFLYNSAKKALVDFTWSACATELNQFTIGTMAFLMGGNVRVGMEDNLYIEAGTLAKSNAEQVEKIVRILKEFGHEPATPDEARQILGLKGQDKVNF
jgi:uncharacterized protein (DUF849 family)